MKPRIRAVKFIKKDGCIIGFDANGRITYYVTSCGSWIKYEHDSNGNITYHENSDGEWIKREFDDNGKLTYLENSEGWRTGVKR